MRFIDSWSADDEYDRFGILGSNGQKRLAVELTQHERAALIAVHASRVVGLLDYVYAQGAIHIGIVVDSRYRLLSIGTNLVVALLQARAPARPVEAECRIDNRPAAALFRTCGFQCARVERPEMVWRFA